MSTYSIATQINYGYRKNNLKHTLSRKIKISVRNTTGIRVCKII